MLFPLRPLPTSSSMPMTLFDISGKSTAIGSASASLDILRHTRIRRALRRIYIG